MSTPHVVSMNFIPLILKDISNAAQQPGASHASCIAG